MGFFDIPVETTIEHPDCSIVVGNCLDILPTLAASSAQSCVTSPPYFGLRDYGVDGQIGLEPSPDEYVAELVKVFRGVWRVLRDDGTLWLNLGDSYCTTAPGSIVDPAKMTGIHVHKGAYRRPETPPGLKPKDLIGIPWRVAFALQADGWYLRSGIVWNKLNPMPESATDRPTSSYEMVFLMSKAVQYYYDAAAIAELSVDEGRPSGPKSDPSRNDGNRTGIIKGNGATRNARNVWTISTLPYDGAHFAVMPPALAGRCIKAGSRPGDLILDPFGGAATTGLAAAQLGRKAMLIELNPASAKLGRERVARELYR
jgi:DNA modification methylase